MSETRLSGTILKALSGFYYVKSGDRLYTCRARGKFRYQNITPYVGDRIEMLVQDEETGVLDRILPRSNEFKRPAIANIDQMVIVVSGAIPVTDPFLIDQMTSIVEGRNCEPVICINKWDLHQAEELYDCYVKAGFTTIKMSARTGMGIDELQQRLLGKVSAFTGNSGVGKSSLLNALDPKLRIQVGEISEKLGRGRHTTRHIELFKLNGGGYLADTPGFSAFDAEKMEPRPLQELEKSFREFLPYLDHCRYIGCSHVKEKDCAVRQALEEGKIAPSRHQSYVRLYEKAKERKTWK
jgi:ribosome biogenesis GTPase